MFCANCGSSVEAGVKFCPNCGGAVGVGNPTPTVTSTPPKKKSVLPIVLGIIFGVVVLFILVVLAVFFLVFKAVDSASTKLVCESKEGNITISFNGDSISGYHANGITYDQTGQNKICEKVGSEEYMKQFNDWFEKNTSGTCTVQNENGEIINSFSNEGNNTINNNGSNFGKDTSSTKIVGKDTYGYVEVPSNWVNFQDVDGGHSIQFSYGTSYIVTLDYVANPNGTAKQYAESFYKKQLEDSNIKDVKASTVYLGKNKNITAYQVSQFYIQENLYLYTYWFDGPDGNLHYVAIEGPEGLDKYLDIPKTFSFTK